MLFHRNYFFFFFLSPIRQRVKITFSSGDFRLPPPPHYAGTFFYRSMGRKHVLARCFSSGRPVHGPGRSESNETPCTTVFLVGNARVHGFTNQWPTVEVDDGRRITAISRTHTTAGCVRRRDGSVHVALLRVQRVGGGDRFFFLRSNWTSIKSENNKINTNSNRPCPHNNTAIAVRSRRDARVIYTQNQAVCKLTALRDLMRRSHFRRSFRRSSYTPIPVHFNVGPAERKKNTIAFDRRVLTDRRHAGPTGRYVILFRRYFLLKKRFLKKL